MQIPPADVEVLVLVKWLLLAVLVGNVWGARFGHEGPKGDDMRPVNAAFEKELDEKLSRLMTENESLFGRFDKLEESQRRKLGAELRYFMDPKINQFGPVSTVIVPMGGRAHHDGCFLIFLEVADKKIGDRGYVLFDAKTRTHVFVRAENAKWLKLESGKLGLLTDPKKKPMTFHYGMEKFSVTSAKDDLSEVKLENTKGQSFLVSYDPKQKRWLDPKPVN